MAGNTVTVLITAKDDASKKLDGITKLSLGLSAGFAAVGVASVKMAADFERGLDQVGAVAGATESEMKSLRTEALKIGADTSKSAGEAAAAMEELAAGGRSVAQIMGGEARAAVALAEAGNYGLADSARTIATAMDVWKDSSINTTDVVNRLAGAANTSRFGVEDMSQAIAAGGGVASSAGVDFQEFSTAIAATASSFNSGSDAGTSFKTFITSLTGNSETAKKAISELGLSFYDAQGALRPMSEIVQELHDKMGPLSQQQQTVYLKQIFGNDAFRTAAGLMKLTGEEFSAMSDKMGSTNAADVAKQRMSNLSGQVEALKGSMETLAISLGSKAIPALTEVAGVATKGLNAFGALPESTQSLALGFTALAAATPALISGVDKTVASVKALGSASLTANASMALLAGGVGAVVIAGDILTKKFTGHSLMEIIFGDVEGSESAKKFSKAVADATAVAKAHGKEVDALDITMQAFRSELRLNTETFADGTGKVRAGAREYELFSSAVDKVRAAHSKGSKFYEEHVQIVKNLGEAMQQAGAKTSQYEEIHNLLTGDLQKAFDATVNYTEVIKSQGVVFDGWSGSVARGKDAVGALASATPPAVSAIAEWTAGVAEAEDGTKDFKEALEQLTNQFAAANPTVIALNAQHAKLTEELEDLKDKGDKATAADRERIKVIEGQLIPAIDKEIKVYADNQKAMEGMQGAVVNMIGQGGYGALLDVMGRLKVPQEDQIALTGKIATAYQNLTKGDIPAAIKGFGEMKKELSPEVWKPIGEAVGPALGAAIRQSFTGEEADRMVAAARSLGINIGDGIEQGLGSVANKIQEKGRGIIRGLIETMESEAQTASPSKKTTYIGEMMGEGLKVGMLSREKEILETADKIAQGALAKLAAGVPGAAADLSGGKSYTYDPTQNKWVPVGTSNETFGGMSTAGLEAAAAGVAAGGGNLAGVPGHDWVFKDGKWQLESIQNTSANPWYFNTINPVTGKRETGTINPNTGYANPITINIGTVNARDEAEARQAGGDMAYALATRGLAVA